jgi:hypothetical protein
MRMKVPLAFFRLLLRLIVLFLCVHLFNCSQIIAFPQLQSSGTSSSSSSSTSFSKSKYTTFQCIGGSQVLKTESLKQASIKVWPLNDPEFRSCHFRNICLINGTLTYFQKYAKGDSSFVSNEYLPNGFNDGYICHLSYLRAFTMQIKTEYETAIPSSLPFHDIPLVFLDSNSWSFNYGHYLNDNIIPTFMIAKLFNLNFENSQQLFETSCRLFSTLEPAFANRIVTYNRSMGTYRNACLQRLNSMWIFFYKKPPIYVDDYVGNSLCFQNLIIGQGSMFGLKSLDLSRGLYYRQFRDYIVQKKIHWEKPFPPKAENLILVGVRTIGSAGGAVINDLCDLVKTAKEKLHNIEYKTKYSVECFIPSDLSFEEEIYQVQRAKVIISVHGTITYMALFSKDGTQQISVASPKELKENQMLLYGTHFHTLYLTWDKLEQLAGLLEHSLNLSEAYYENNVEG